MEILIAMTVLMLGLLPMLAVFRVAIANANHAIQDTYASTVAQSVVDAIRLGMKEQLVVHDDGQTKFFVFDHDGWSSRAGPSDTDPRTQLERDRQGFLKDLDITAPGAKAGLLQKDYVILLPRVSEKSSLPASGRPLGKEFLYPRKDPGDNAGRREAEYYDKKLRDDSGAPLRDADGQELKTKEIRVERVFELGHKLKEATHQVEATDTYSQYSFAFTLSPAKAPNLKEPEWEARKQRIEDGEGAYEVKVRIYRNFNKNVDSPRNEPVREFITYVAE